MLGPLCIGALPLVIGAQFKILPDDDDDAPWLLFVLLLFRLFNVSSRCFSRAIANFELEFSLTTNPRVMPVIL